MVIRFIYLHLSVKNVNIHQLVVHVSGFLSSYESPPSEKDASYGEKDASYG